MTFDRPWALVLLVAAPLLWWLHRRRSFVVVRVASVAPFRTAPTESSSRADRRGPDVVLVCLATSAAALALAAAGPAWSTGSPRALVVVDATASMGARLADGGGSVGSRALTRARRLLGDAAPGATLDERPRAEPSSPADVAAFARSQGYPGAVFVTERADGPDDPDVVVVGPDAGAGPNVGIVGVALDGDDAVVSIAAFGGAPRDGEVLGPDGETRSFHVVPGAVVLVRVAAPRRGAQAEIAIRTATADSLEADDRVRVNRTGGAARVRLVSDAPRLRAALRALAIDVTGESAADAVVLHGGELTRGDSPVVHFAPRSAAAGAPMRVTAYDGGPFDAGAVARVGVESFPIPPRGARLVARVRLEGGAPLLEDSAGVLAAHAGAVVAVAFDPDAHDSDWHRDGSFVATVGAAIDLACGGPDRVDVVLAVPATESDVVRDPRAATPAPGALRAVLRPDARVELSGGLSALGAVAAAAAAWFGRRR